MNTVLSQDSFLFILQGQWQSGVFLYKCKFREQLMASYVESSLTTGEKVEQRAQITKVIYVRPVFWLVVTVLFCLGGLGIVPVALFIVTAISLIRTFLVVSTTELAVTNKRVLAKFGIIKRSTIELNLTSVESVNLEQGILGRVLNYGSLVFNGTGSSGVPVPYISHPLEFKKLVLEKAEAAAKGA